MESTLREVVHTLAGLERRAGSTGEREAAQWLAGRLTRAGAPATVEEVDFHDGYALLLLPLGVAGLLAGALHASGRSRGRAGLVAATSSALLIDDVSNGLRLWRRLAARRKRTWNVLATAGDPQASDTLVVLAHHDAAPTGYVFDQRFQRWLARRFPALVARIDTSLPLWWPVVSGGLLVSAGALLGNRRLSAAGTVMAGLVVGLAADVARSPVVPGANDNLSAVAALVALAEQLRSDPPSGLRVLLVSCGAEEVIQGGIYAFARSHFPCLPCGSTWFVNLDTVGSPELVLVEGEGPFRMEDYCEPRFRDLLAEVAREVGRPVRRGVRARASTDAVIPSRAGYPTATFASWEPDTKLLSNYHLMSDTPENLCLETVVHAVDVVHALAHRLARQD
jgi:hypothetical protein